MKSLPFKQINAKQASAPCLLGQIMMIHPSHPPGSALFSDAILLLQLWRQHRIFVWCHRQHICHSMKKLWIWWICQSHASCDCHLVIHQASAAAAWARARLLAPWNCLNASCPTPFSSSGAAPWRSPVPDTPPLSSAFGERFVR